MGRVVALSTTASAMPESRCPFHHQSSGSAEVAPVARPGSAPALKTSISPGEFNDWLEHGLQCSAGKREFKLGRYHVAHISNGLDFAREMAEYKLEVQEYRKVGFLAILKHDQTKCPLAEDELWLLGRVIREAGMTESVASLIAGETIGTPIEVTCPVTGEQTIYEFFSVAFCQNQANPSDPLYDPSLSAPFTAINTTSDAFAFALLVREQSLKVFGCLPHQLKSRDDCELLCRKCVVVWQNMSATTILNYNKVSVDPSRAVHLSEDRRFWIAPHNDPVFGELEKRPHLHEMPAVYARRLCDKWLATLYEGKEYVPSRDGQSGGIPTFEVEGVPHELYQF